MDLHDKVRILSIPELEMKAPSPEIKEVQQNSQESWAVCGATVLMSNVELFVPWHHSARFLPFTRT